MATVVVILGNLRFSPSASGARGVARRRVRLGREVVPEELDRVADDLF